jgi:soluble lytic murein transglycosylase-like protein
MLRIHDQDVWSPDRYHSIEQGTVVYKLTEGGILVKGQEQERRTKGQPLTLSRIMARYIGAIRDAAGEFAISEQLIAATIANESGGHENAERNEPARHDRSIGVMQILTATAKELSRRIDEPFLEPSLPDGGDLEKWRTYLNDDDTSIRLGAYYLSWLNKEFDCRGDPVMIYAAYNAGSLRADARCPWGLHYNRVKRKDGTIFDAMDTFVAWYGDACTVWERHC